MLTREQKQKLVKKEAEEIKKGGSLLFADFSGIPNNYIKTLRKLLHESGAGFKVVKKRLLKIAFKEAGIDYDPKQFNAQAGMIYSANDILSIAGSVYKFSKDLVKEKMNFSVLGGIDLKEKKAISADEFIVLAKLPSKETLIAQIAIALTMPIRQLAYALNSRKEQIK